MKTLVSLLKENQEITNRVLEGGGEIDDVLEFQLDSNSDLLEDKVDGYFFVIQEFEARENYFSKIEEQAYEAKKVCSNAVKRIKDHLKESMKNFSVKELNGDTARFSLSSSKPAVDVFDESLLPGKYMREKISLHPDKDLIKSDLELGLEIPGVRLLESTSLRSKLNTKKIEGK